MNFYSCSGDGRVTNWTIVKTALWFSDLLVVNFTKELKNFKNAVAGVRDGVRTFAFKPDDDTVYLIGTEEGDIHLPLLYPSCTVLYCSLGVPDRYGGGGHPPRHHRVLHSLPDDLPRPRHPRQQGELWLVEAGHVT